MNHQSIIIADDHSMIRKGLKLFMQLNLNCDDIEEVGSCGELMNALVRERYTHLILDIILSDGNALEIIPNIKKVYPDLNILIFSMQPADIYADAMRQYGIEFYLSKSVSEEDIQQTIHEFLNNKQAPKFSEFQKKYSSNPFSSLAPRELEILHYLLKGMRTKEIGETLNLKMSTVSTMKNRIYEKTSSSNIKELIELATLYNLNY